MSHHTDQDKVWDLIDDIKFAMLVTHDGEGDELRARPMHAHGERKEDAIKRARDNGEVQRALAGLKTAARGTDNVMYPILEASRAYATLGEMCDALREVFGEYDEPPVF